MVFQFKFPDVGEGITEGEIVSWKVKLGDIVKADDVLCEVETDKSVVEVPSPKAGKIVKMNGKEGEVINVGDVLVEIDETGKGEVKEDIATPPPAEKTIEKPPAPKEAPKEEPAEKPKGASVVGVLEEAPDEEVKETKKEHHEAKTIVPATPAARAAAKQEGVDIQKIKGSGPEGTVKEKDIEKGEAPKAEKKPGLKKVRKYDLWGYVDRKPFKGIRKIIAKNMIRSASTVAAVTHMDDADVTELWNIRKKEKEMAAKKEIKLTFLPFITKAVISALKQYPMINSSLNDEDEEIIIKKYYNIGIAMDSGNGLIVPVIKGADEKSILQLAKEIQEFAAKTAERKIDPGDMKGGTFTITNWGSVGGKHGTPIINYPECAILGIGRIYEKVVMIKGNITTRKILPISITFDHRITDGAEIAAFCNTIIQHLEDPDLMLIEAEG